MAKCEHNDTVIENGALVCDNCGVVLIPAPKK